MAEPAFLDSVTVDLGNGVTQEVKVDPQRGPLVQQPDGSFSTVQYAENGWAFNDVGSMNCRVYCKSWEEMGKTERNYMLHIAAKKNRSAAQQALGPRQELPDFLQELMVKPIHWNTDEQESFFTAMAAPPGGLMGGDMADEPVLVVFYSGGMSVQQGNELVAEFLESARAKGISDQVVLNHPEFDGYKIEGEGTDPWPQYVDALVREIDSKPELAGRPLLVWGHSKGATVAMTLAARLGPRVLKVYCCASGAPTPGEVSPFQTMAENFKKGTDLDLLKWFCSLNADRALHRMVEACDKGELTVESSPYLQGKLSLMKKQYVNCIYPDMNRDFQVLSTPIMALWPHTDASSPKESMEAWQAWTTGPFELKKIDAGHMDCLRTRQHHDYVVADMVRVARAAQS